MALCTEQGFAMFLAGGAMYRGWALAEQGHGKEGIVQIRQGLTAYRATGAEMGRPYFLALLAEAYGKVGDTEQGLATLVEAFALVEQTGERWYEAELYRIKGELMLARSKVQSLKSKVEEEAEACFLKAIEIARKQQAKSLELRAVTSLVRLRQHQAQDHATRNTQHGLHTTQHETRTRLDETHLMLSEVYGWFTEGFDTKDLQEAKAVLKTLS